MQAPTTLHAAEEESVLGAAANPTGRRSQARRTATGTSERRRRRRPEPRVERMQRTAVKRRWRTRKEMAAQPGLAVVAAAKRRRQQGMVAVRTCWIC